jgi:hypothetical protein
MDAFSLAAANLISPPILFFALGLAAALAGEERILAQHLAEALNYRILDRKLWAQT